MQQARYKVETFIIPKGNQCYNEFMTNEEGNLKIADKFRKQNEKEEIVNTEVFKNTDAEGECRIPIMQMKDYFTIFKRNNQKVCTVNKTTVSQTQMQRFNSLISIDEKSEDVDDACDDVCYHGHKNGCTVSAPSPEDISEEIFKKNWSNRLEILRNREAALNDKEIALQCRERLLFQKEKELRILERQLKERLKQMEQYCKRIQRSHKVNSKDMESVTESRSSSESGRSHSSSTVFSSNLKSFPELHLSDKIIHNACEYVEQGILHCNTTQDTCSEAKMESVGEIKHNDKQTSLENNRFAKQMGTKSFTNSTVTNSSKFQSGSYYRTRQRTKILYDDLDSTLSADIGDSSFIQTAKKFNPADYKKPFAFTRSASERRHRHVSNSDSSTTGIINTNTLKDTPSPLDCIEENKIFKRVSDNITASSNGCTIFQDYGLIDQKLATSKNELKNVLCDDTRYSYLNLEVEQNSAQSKKAKPLKERPISWCEETNEWLQKKRQAYNLTTKRILTEDFDNKENTKLNIKGDRMDKSSKKKDVRKKMFTIFR